jgi:hypothetical protein
MHRMMPENSSFLFFGIPCLAASDYPPSHPTGRPLSLHFFTYSSLVHDAVLRRGQLIQMVPPVLRRPQRAA